MDEGREAFRADAILKAPYTDAWGTTEVTHRRASVTASSSERCLPDARAALNTAVACRDESCLAAARWRGQPPSGACTSSSSIAPHNLPALRGRPAPRYAREHADPRHDHRSHAAAARGRDRRVPDRRRRRPVRFQRERHELQDHPCMPPPDAYLLREPCAFCDELAAFSRSPPSRAWRRASLLLVRVPTSRRALVECMALVDQAFEARGKSPSSIAWIPKRCSRTARPCASPSSSKIAMLRSYSSTARTGFARDVGGAAIRTQRLLEVAGLRLRRGRPPRHVFEYPRADRSRPRTAPSQRADVAHFSRSRLSPAHREHAGCCPDPHPRHRGAVRLGAATGVEIRTRRARGSTRRGAARTRSASPARSSSSTANSRTVSSITRRPRRRRRRLLSTSDSTRSGPASVTTSIASNVALPRKTASARKTDASSSSRSS